MGKLKQLADYEDLDVMEMLEQASYDSVAPGICDNPGCDYVATVEPDCDAGECEICGTFTVKSCLILAGLI